jgi:radical SAM superfamily enzyme YgiQ (UPF0313 family)
MSKVGLICTTQVDLGLRTVSGQLQSRQIDTICFFLDSIQDNYPEPLLESVKQQLQGVSLVGVSLVEMGKNRAVQITRYLREQGFKVIWGGAYPTLAPMDAIQYTDFVCVGEGDDTMPALVHALEQDGDLNLVPNLVYRSADGNIRQTQPAALKVELDQLPFPDYFTPGKHFDLTASGELHLMEGGFPRMERATLRFQRNLWMMFGRGCHLKCTYCSVPTLGKSAEGLGRFFRFKSPAVMVDEIESALRQTGGADYIYIMDNDFCALPLRKIDEFCRLYRERIKIPFFCYGTPLTIKQDKVRSLISAGLERLDFGIQSGSDRVLAIYKRSAQKSNILAAADAIAAAIHEAEAQSSPDNYPSWQMKPYFDVIFNAPFEEKEDLLETIDVIKRIGRMGFDFGLFCQPLTFFKNTGLYDQADQGSLGDISLHSEEYYASLSYQQIAEHIVGRGKHVYLNTLIYWMRYDHTRRWAGIIPRIMLEAMTNHKLVDFFEKVNDSALFKWFAKLVNFSMPTRDRRFFIARRLRAAFAHSMQ